MQEFEYGPFGEVIRATGLMARANPVRFSTKYQDDETDLVYYGRRYLSLSTARWITRDPIQEAGGENLYGFIRNAVLGEVDNLGLCTPPCKCGPEISRQLDRTLLSVDQAFWRLSEKEKHKACDKLYDFKGVIFGDGGGVKAWDIEPLYTWGTIDKLVSFHGKCYNAGSVNYALWGRANCDCREAKELYDWGYGFDSGDWTLEDARFWAWTYKILVQRDCKTHVPDLNN